jgi:hypothetical protein
MSINPNGTYNGHVSDASESHVAVLTITASDPQTGIISKGHMVYYGLNFAVRGNFTYQNLSNESPVSFALQAEATDNERTLLTINMGSPDRSYQNLDGTVYVARGGPNIGKSYNIHFQKG